MNALLKSSIFEDAEFERVPIRPVRTYRKFGEENSFLLSPEVIKARIDHLVLYEHGVGGSETADLQPKNTQVMTEADGAKDIKLNRLLNVRKPAPLFFTSTFSPIQEWEGYVRGFDTESMSVDLVDMTARKNRISHHAEIPLEEISDIDRERLRIGAIFRWSIGYQRTSRGTKTRVSNIVFRDLPQWTQRDIREAKQEARDLEQYFKSGRPDLPRVNVDSTKDR